MKIFKKPLANFEEIHLNYRKNTGAGSASEERYF